MPESTKTKTKPSISQALVIGGAGFVGSYVCESLLAQNLQVVAIDDLSSGKEEYLEPLLKDKNFQFIKLDIDQSPFPEFPNVKYIFHIGGIESYINGVDLSLKTMLVNSIGTYNILELARKNNARLLLASSLDIYSGIMSSLNLKNYFGQSDRDIKRYTHHEAKRYAEALVTEYYRKYELDARIVRVADVYGPRMDLSSGTEIAQLFQEAITSDALTIHGDGLKTLHPTFVTDVVAGITKAMFTEDTSGKIYNITAHEEINVLNFAYTIQKNSTKPLKIQFTQEYKEVKFPLHPTEIQQTESELAWNAKTKLPEGVTLTLEYFFLRAAKEKPEKKKAAAVEKTPALAPTENPDSSKTILLENMSSKEVKPIPRSAELSNKVTKDIKGNEPKATGEEKTNHPINKWNALILATSLFVVLTLFIFPMLALYSTNDKSVAATQEALSQESLESAINAQENLYYGNVQYDNLEWFFNTIQKRSAFENTRASLQALDKINIAVAVQSKLRSTVYGTVNALVNGKATTAQIESSKQQLTTSFISIQNAVIENETVKQKLAEADSEVLLSQATTGKLNEILMRAEPLLKKYEQQSSLMQNVVQFLSPAQSKAYLVIFQDTLYPNKLDAKVLGYAYVQLGKNGIAKVNLQQYQYKNDKANSTEVIKDILDQSKTNGWLPLSAIFMGNTTTLEDLVIAEGSLTVSTLAQIVSANDIEQKLLENRANNEFQYLIWKEIFTSIPSLSNDKLSKVGTALYNGILHEDIKMLTQDDKGTVTFPVCDTNRILQRDFVNSDDQLYPNKTNGNPYCVVLQERQISVQTTKNLQKSIELTADEKDQDNYKFKLTYTIKNNSKTTFNGDVELSFPGTPQLTNLQLVFPLSLDKAKSEKKDNNTSYTVNVNIEPGTQKELVIEWTSKKSDGDINKSGIYLAKPYGTAIDKSSITINRQKPATAVGQNSDLYLN